MLCRSSFSCSPRPLVAALGLAVPVAAQTPTATLAIEVRDESDALMPGVTVMLTNQDSGIGRRGITNAQGTLVVPLLPRRAPTRRRRARRLQDRDRSRHPPAGVGQEHAQHRARRRRLTEQVVVTADRDDAASRQQRRRRGVRSTETLCTLPVPSVTRCSSRNRRPAWRRRRRARACRPRATSASTAAARAKPSNNFLLDGVDNNDLFLNRLVVNPSLDAIEEIALLQNTYDADYGRSAGAQVNVVAASRARATCSGSRLRVLPPLDARRPQQPASRRRRRSRGCASTSSAARSAGRSAAGRRSSSSTSKRIDAREADTRLAHVPTAAERSGDFSASRRRRSSIRSRSSRSPATSSRPSRISAAGAAAGRRSIRRPTAPTPCANFVSSPAGRARRHPVRRSRPIITAGSDRPIQRALHASAATIATCRSRRAAATCPASASSVLDQGHKFVGRALADARAALFNEIRVRLQRAAPREPAAERRRRPASPRSASRRRRSTRRSTRAIPPPSCPASRRSATIPICRCVRQTRTLHLSETLGARSRPAPRQDRRRAAALPVGRLQPPVLARRRRRSPAPSPAIRSATAARLPDDHAARRQRQPPGAADVVGQRLRAGRLARHAAADGQRRRPLRVQRAAVRRRRSHGGSSTSTTRQLLQVGAGRRVALGARRRPQQLRAARRRRAGT